jgi:preprotein translocase subunit SecA
VKGLSDDLSILLLAPIRPGDLEGNRYDDVQEKAVELAHQAYERRERELGEPAIREIERGLYLYTIDEHWRDHLYELDHLRGGIGLRAYGQRDPLLEYKAEAFKLFEDLLGAIREEYLKRIFRVELREEGQMIPRPRAPRRMVAQHAEAVAFGGPQPAGEPAQEAARAEAQGEARAVPVRSGPRVGRNDPCPCGSGKKYKKCHMLVDEGVGSGR